MLKSVDAIRDVVTQLLTQWHDSETALSSQIEVSLEGAQARVRLALAWPLRDFAGRLRAELEQRLAAEGLGLAALDVVLDVSGRTVAEDDPVPHVKNVVLVMSGKGGVGKSTVCANLACAMAAMGARVGLLDADIYGPSVPTLFAVRSQPAGDGQKIHPIEKHGVKLMSIGFLLENEKSAVVVTTPQEMALQDVYKAVAMNQKVGIPVLGVVENQSYFVCGNCSTRHELFGRGGGQTIAEQAGAPLLGQLPLMPEVQRASDAGLPVVKSQPDGDAASAFFEVAERLGRHISEENGGGLGELTIDRSGGKNRRLPIAR